MAPGAQAAHRSKLDAAACHWRSHPVPPIFGGENPVNMRHFINSLVILLIAAVAGFAAALLLAGCHKTIYHPTPVIQTPAPVVPVTPAVTMPPAQPPSGPPPGPTPGPGPRPQPEPPQPPHPGPSPEPKPSPTPLPPPPVCLCHNEKTTLCRPPVGNLPPGAWNAHLSHGDPVGVCR